MIYRDNIPPALKRREQWICWRREYRDGQDKPTKAPINPGTGGYASTADPDTWTSFESAYTRYTESRDVDGLGYVFTDDDPYIGVDLDDCRTPDTGRLTDWAKDIIQRLDSYTETSPSGTGVHVIVAGEKPAGKYRSGDVEMYDTDRYFTVTGDHLDLTPATVSERSEELQRVHEDYVADDTDDTTESVEPPATNGGLDDSELIEKAKNAANGDKFQRLWRGDTSAYPSHSEADQALCNLLAYWTGGDPHQMERLFEQSGLTREKWRDREDYRERTTRNAIQGCTDYYSGSS